MAKLILGCPAQHRVSDLANCWTATIGSFTVSIRRAALIAVFGLAIFGQAVLAQQSQEALNKQCEAARERMIAPLREAEIEKCKKNKRADPKFCERFYADFGQGGRAADGTIILRMFDDLPECVAAFEARRQRGHD